MINVGLETESSEPQPLRNALHKRCFACTKIALQTDHIARLQRSAQTHANPARLFGAAAEKIHRVCIQNGHRRDYIRRMNSTPNR